MWDALEGGLGGLQHSKGVRGEGKDWMYYNTVLSRARDALDGGLEKYK